MSLNFVETLLDKLIYTSHGGKDISFPRKFSGSQNLMGTNPRMSILSEFHQLLDSAYLELNVSDMNLSPGVKNNFQYFGESSNHSLVSRVPKLFVPSFSILQRLQMLSSQAELLLESEFCSNPRGSILHETLDQLDLFKTNGFDIQKSQPISKMPVDPVKSSPNCAKPPENVANDSTTAIPNDVLLKSQKHIFDSCNTLNQELINRKAKELNKRSRKRRRRQKKNNVVNSKKECSVGNSKQPISNKESGNTSHLSCSPVSENLSVNCDISCDIVSIRGQANRVQIMLPDLPSFVISVESGDEDDADWDACSDSEWLTECAEFELSGLFVANLTAPKISDCPVKGLVSHLDVPPNQDDKEAYKLQNLLFSVNRTWNETTKELERKPKLPTKVSFAPEEDLVQVLFVEQYERKGEWETFALERMRFRKRIDELESVLSPCLSKEHRAKVFLRMNETNL